MNKIEFGWLDEKVIIRVVGKGSFLNSRHFKEGLVELLKEGYRNITVDFKDCVGMDSTFIGVLTGLTLKMIKSYKTTVSLANLGKTNMELLDTLGVIRFFHTIEQPCTFDTRFESVEDIPEDPDEAINQIRHILEAHETLMKADQKNVERFKLVKEQLEKDLSSKLQDKDKSKS
ncbi:MAG: STAS domain-containing protein [Candidatus Auribacterota bacterium]|jgi:anti-anti-sigma regulatory factor|uniref:Anti-sigma factor antagonist n=1 Tax=Candidatus Auribacter fodinae TaxID=2093366 RepID=A0A3A4R829_9BACT|nr:MAG: anti-sigma factor antagonist [Candidatus Auribacter fodinae]